MHMILKAVAALGYLDIDRRRREAGYQNTVDGLQVRPHDLIRTHNATQEQGERCL